MRLSICMIIKNEEAVLARCLKCVERFADEIIIVDTGSKDNSVKIAKKFTQNIYEIKWENSFCKARNYSYSKATGDYIMWLDADDIITDENINKLKTVKNTITSNIDIVYTIYRNKQSDGLDTYVLRDRIVKRNINPQWKYDVHESINVNPNWKKIIYQDIEIVHKKETVNEPNRNLDIFNNLLKKGYKLDSFELSNYCKELVFHKQFDKAIMFYKQLKQIYNSSNYLYYALFFVVYAYLEKKLYKECIQEINYIFSVFGETSFMLYYKGVCCEKLEKYNEALECYNMAIKNKNNIDATSVKKKGYSDYFPLLGKASIAIHDLNFELATKYTDEASMLYPNDKSWKLMKIKILFNNKQQE